MKDNLKKYVILTLTIVFSVFTALYLYDKFQEYQFDKVIADENEKKLEQERERFLNKVKVEFKRDTSFDTFAVEITNFNDRTIHGYIEVTILDKNEEELEEELVFIPKDGIKTGDTYRYVKDYVSVENADSVEFEKSVY